MSDTIFLLWPKEEGASVAPLFLPHFGRTIERGVPFEIAAGHVAEYAKHFPHLTEVQPPVVEPETEAEPDIPAASFSGPISPFGNFLAQQPAPLAPESNEEDAV